MGITSNSNTSSLLLYSNVSHCPNFWFIIIPQVFSEGTVKRVYVPAFNLLLSSVKIVLIVISVALFAPVHPIWLKGTFPPKTN